MEPGRQEANRRTLAETLRELRRAAGLSGERLAARCAMSQTKISRIETGKTLPAVIDVERILRALDVPSGVAAELLALVRVANVDYRSLRASARAGFWHRQAQLTALEKSSTMVRHFLPAIPTGLLQVEEYARQVLTPTVPGRPDRDIERVLRGRMERQAVLDEESTRFIFLMTEQAVRWRIAPDEVMVKQLTHMADVAEKPTVEIAIIPRSARVSNPPLNIFVIYDNRLVTVEIFSGLVALRDPQDIAQYVSLFEFFLGHALQGSDAVGFLSGVAKEFMRGRD